MGESRKLKSVRWTVNTEIKDIFSVAPGTDIRSPGTLVFCALNIACEGSKIHFSWMLFKRKINNTSKQCCRICILQKRTGYIVWPQGDGLNRL